AAITPRTRAIVLNTPMNPCGKVFDGPELDFIAELLIAHDLVAICDEVYEHLTFEDRAPLPLMTRPGVRARCLRIGSAGKTFSVTGWKIGYVSGDAALLAPVARAHQVTTFSTPPFLQTAVAHGLRLADGYFDGLRATLRTRRDLLSRGLTEAGFEVLGCQGTYFLLAGTDGAEDDVGFCRRLVEEAGVTAIPLSGFFTPAGRRPLVRFCFAKRLETLEGGIARLVAWRGGQRWRRAS
ncbi:MAG TPA: aminotransferase, partial [Rhodospirillum rubrum]|nr:aminotransferase [Rhodospirillum rubrum]